MTLIELATALRQMYDDAPAGRRKIMIHLFGIRYASQITESGCSPKEIARAAGLEKYYSEINSGIRLSEFVVEKH